MEKGENGMKTVIFCYEETEETVLFDDDVDDEEINEIFEAWLQGRCDAGWYIEEEVEN